MIIIKNKRAIEKMRRTGALLADVMTQASQLVVAGVSTAHIDRAIEQMMRERDLIPVCKGYGTYKHATCISLNNTVVHGVPSEEIILNDGDVVSIDLVGRNNGYCADMARTFFVGEVSETAVRLKDTAQRALDAVLQMIRPGLRVGDISSCIQAVVEKEKFGIVEVFAGHGIGKNLHEDPDVPNYGKAGEGPLLQAGMTLAIEPMITERSHEIEILADGWTANTKDGGLAVHVEDTVLITEHGAEVLTRVAAE